MIPERYAKYEKTVTVGAVNFTPAELAQVIARRVPGFRVDYDIDPMRQGIADSWPNSLDDTAARGIGNLSTT